MLGDASVYDLAQRKGKEILAHGAQYAGSALGPEMVRPLLARGPAAQVLCEHSGTAEMVVVGSRGHGRVAGLLLGSVAWQVADAPDMLGGVREMEAAFNSAMTMLEKDHPDVAVLRQVAQGSPRTALLAAASEAQLLVVGCRGRGGIRGMSPGSVAQAMLHYARCPVAVIHPPAGASDRRPDRVPGGGEGSVL